MSAPQWRIRQYHYLSEDSHVHPFLVDLWSEVHEATGGRVTATVHAKNQGLPGSHLAIVDLLIAGDIDIVVNTHLHFDHCGGGVTRNGEKLQLTFNQARYWSNKDHWQWAVEPNPREKASFLKENILPMEESGHLQFISPGQSPFPNIDLLLVSGHTDKMMIPRIRYKSKVICFMADLIPSVSHIPLPYVMGYDTRPLLTMEEKEAFLREAADHHYILFFEHDPLHECCTVKHTEKGVRLDRTFPLQDIL